MYYFNQTEKYINTKINNLYFDLTFFVFNNYNKRLVWVKCNTLGDSEYIQEIIERLHDQFAKDFKAQGLISSETPSQHQCD